MKRILGIKSKYFYTFLSITIFLVLLLSTFFLVLSFLNNKPDGDVIHAVTLAASDQVIDDPTKITPPDWANLIIVIAIFVVIGILGIGIIGFSIYIIVYFYQKRHGKLAVKVKDYYETTVTEDQKIHDIVSVTVNEKGEVNEKK